MVRLVAVFAVMAAAVGCGGDEAAETRPPPKPVSKKELRALVGDVGLNIRVAFYRVDEAPERGDTEQLRRALLHAADTQQRQVQRLERVIAPSELRRPLAQLIRATHEQAEDIRALARRRNLSPKVVVQDSLREDVPDKQVYRALDKIERAAPVRR